MTFKKKRNYKKYTKKRAGKQNWLGKPIPPPFFKTNLVKMRVAGLPIIVSATAVTYTQPANCRWCLNMLYNPFGTSQTAFGLDTLNTIYEHWTVVKSKLSVRVHEAGSLNGAQVALSFGAEQDPAWGSIANQMESPGTQSRQCVENKANTLGMTIDIAKHFGKPWKQCSFVKDLTGTGNTPPLDGLWAHLGMYSLSTCSFYIIPMMECYVIFTERKNKIP